MGEFTGITAARAEEILAESVVSGALNEGGSLIFTRGNGETINGGNFGAIVNAVMEALVESTVAVEVPKAVLGKVVAKGDVEGQITFAEFNNNTLVNALITMRLINNATISSADLPSNPKANTQFIVRVTQPATGNMTLTLAGIKKSNGVLELSKAGNAIDVLMFFYDGTNWFVGAMGLDFK